MQVQSLTPLLPPADPGRDVRAGSELGARRRLEDDHQRGADGLPGPAHPVHHHAPLRAEQAPEYRPPALGQGLCNLQT